MKILLLDMDGVLLEPRGYHAALRQTVSLVGSALGYERVDLVPEEIAAFEAAGVSSEWDSAAICAALLLEHLWDTYPDLTLPATLFSPSHPTHDIPSPDFRRFIHLLAGAHLQAPPPLVRAEQLLLNHAVPRTGTQKQALQDTLRNARQMGNSLTHRIFQELVLGSSTFTKTYGLPPCLNAESYLLEYDRPTLSNRARLNFLEWLQDADHQAVILTNRPSRPLAGYGTPEAEIGAQGASLEMLPVVGLGDLTWLSDQLGGDPQSFRKPSPVHVLAALLRAIGTPREHALKIAASLGLEGQTDPVWQRLHKTQVYVFEDAVAGLKSARAARDLLDGIDIPITLHLLGVTESEAKRQALEAAGAVVSVDFATALETAQVLKT